MSDGAKPRRGFRFLLSYHTSAGSMTSHSARYLPAAPAVSGSQMSWPRGSLPHRTGARPSSSSSLRGGQHPQRTDLQMLQLSRRLPRVQQTRGDTRQSARQPAKRSGCLVVEVQRKGRTVPAAAGVACRRPRGSAVSKRGLAQRRTKPLVPSHTLPPMRRQLQAARHRGRKGRGLQRRPRPAARLQHCRHRKARMLCRQQQGAIRSSTARRRQLRLRLVCRSAVAQQAAAAPQASTTAPSPDDPPPRKARGRTSARRDGGAAGSHAGGGSPAAAAAQAPGAISASTSRGAAVGCKTLSIH